MRYVKVGYVADELATRYGIEMDKWDVMRLSASALKRIGAFALQRKAIIATVKNFSFCLPADAYLARGCKRLSTPLSGLTTIIISDGIQQPPQIFFVEPVEENFSSDLLILKDNYVPHLKGEYMDFTYEHPILTFNETNVDIVVEYTGLATDKEGYPMIPEPAWEGCMFFCLFTRLQSGYIAGSVSRSVMKDAEVWKDEGISRSRSKLNTDLFTTNERDKLLNIMVSMDRKAYNIPS